MIITGGIAPNEEGGMVFRDENGMRFSPRQNSPPMPKPTDTSS